MLALDLRNLEVTDLAATNISCDTLSVGGDPVSDVLQNASGIPSETTFVGSLIADEIVSNSSIDSVTGSISGILTSGSLSTGGITCSTLSASSSIEGFLTTAIQNNVVKIGTQTSLACSGNISQTGGTTTLQGTTVGSLSTGGNISQTAGTATLQATTVGSLSTAGNITQTAGTTTLQATTVGSLTTAGNITQTAGTFSIVDLAVAGNLTGFTSRFSSPTAITWGLSAATQSIPNSVVTSVVLGTAKFSSGFATTSFFHVGGNIQNSSGGTRTLLVTYSVTWAASSTNSRNAYITTDANCVPASATVGYSACSGAGGGGVTALTGSAVIQMANAAYISLTVSQNSGGALNITNTGTYLSIAEL